VLNYVEEWFNKTLRYGWMKRFLDRHKSEVSGATGKGQTRSSALLPRRIVDVDQKNRTDCPDWIIFNLDETGLSEWENRRSKPVLAPTQEQESTLHYPVDQSVRYHTLLCCVTASGDSYCPMLIAPTPSARQ
jgi:hypothetical protein